jgi:LPS sulfotransferase NodH
MKSSDQLLEKIQREQPQQKQPAQQQQDDRPWEDWVPYFYCTISDFGDDV